ncbi:uncharacterized protein [Dermacentor andersoni]|uniref:uncharacterized protein n=1 Tax=Dermacentor andersoni TaxID=34620 RepID=UPI002155964F|nr:uncharacterized protein LOC126528155 [Dermacentor andersoni]XP_054925137.1 uncharacterized protein LOC126528155 [Dermacentor andersoni]XP_054925138.1 uncharacterized protein LOC126528155 [Dermacentor andersoni]
MTKAMKSGARCQDAKVNDFFEKGLEENDEPDDPACSRSECSHRGAALVYRECSDKEARVLRRMLIVGPPVRKLCIWEMSLRAFRIAFGRLEGCSSLEELRVLMIVCEEEEEFSVNLSGVFGRLRSLQLHSLNIGTAFAKGIANYLPENTTLREFTLGFSGDDEVPAALIEALIEALMVNNTLKRFTLAEALVSSESGIAFAKMLAVNSTLELVDLTDECSLEAESVSALLEEDRYEQVFKRLRIVWTEQLLPLLTRLIRKKACWPELSVRLSASVDRDVLREFFDAMATDTRIRALHFDPIDETFDDLADGIASVAKRTTTLKEIDNHTPVKPGNEQQLVKVLDALKENRSVTSFVMSADSVTPEIATSLSELLAVNGTLNVISVCRYFEITDDILATLLRGMRKNYTVIHLNVGRVPDYDSKAVLEMEQLVERNGRLHEKAAEFVNAGGDRESDAEGADALQKVRTSAPLVGEVQRLSGKTSDAATELIRAALARLCV